MFDYCATLLYILISMMCRKWPKVGQTEKVCMILIIMKKHCHTHHCDNFTNSLHVTESEKVNFFVCGFLIKIENFVWKLEKCPAFRPMYLILILYGHFAMCPTLGKQVQRSDNEVFLKIKRYSRDTKIPLLGFLCSSTNFHACFYHFKNCDTFFQWLKVAWMWKRGATLFHFVY